MRRAVSCKYMSTTPTVSVMETKMGENLQKDADAREVQATRASPADRSAIRTERAERIDSMESQYEAAAASSQADADEELIFGFD